MTALTGLDEANRKVREWKREAKQSAPVTLADGVDLTMCLEEMQRESAHPAPIRILHSNDILTELVHIPAITTTAGVSAAYGAFMTLILKDFGGTGLAIDSFGFVRRLFRRFLRITMLLITSGAFVRFLRGRYPAVFRVSQYENRSDTADYPCFVANHILLRTSSHAGTHADGPHHFCRTLSHRNYEDAHYNGEAVVLDVSSELWEIQKSFPPDSSSVITAEILEKALAKLPAALLSYSRPLWRLLLVTRRLPSDKIGDDASATAPLTCLPNIKYPSLSPEAAEHLHRIFPQLLLIGIDSPSVDPLEGALSTHRTHQVMLHCGMAVLENLCCARLYPYLEVAVDGKRGCVVGSMLTIFPPTQNYDDARGCAVVFFPERRR